MNPTHRKKSVLDAFQMPNPMSITGRTSTITNSFVSSIIPSRFPSESEVKEALDILGLDSDDLRCAYCGGPSTEWDHLRPLVRGKMPTGYISEIANLVPACGKSNQSKGKQEWEAWMRSAAPKSPASRMVPDLETRIQRLKKFEKWKDVSLINFEAIVGSELWEKHWRNNEQMHELMRECQALADLIRKKIQTSFESSNGVKSS
jgi:hypothetical protein